MIWILFCDCFFKSLNGTFRERFDRWFAHYYQDQADSKSLSTSRQTEEMTFRVPTYQSALKALFTTFSTTD